MDGSRISDLEVLTNVLDDPDESVAHKRQATRAMKRIKQQINDPKLKSLRERLIRATQAEDPEEAAKISDEIQDYQNRNYKG